MEDSLPWILFNVGIVIMLALDLFVFHRKAHEVGIKEAVCWSLIWVGLALLFNVYIYYARGSYDALKFFTGYVIEKSLSIDNLFVFMLIFHYFHTPAVALHKVLFWGVLGAIVFRAIFIWLGIALVTQFSWMFYIFGIFLIITGIKFWFEKDKKVEPEKNPVLRLFRRFFSVTKDYVDDHFFIREKGKWIATPLFIVLLSVECSDIIFAIDSIPAILAITTDPFLVYTSNIFAILGLRSLYFVLSHTFSLFHYLHYGLALILIFIGIKMTIVNWVHIPTAISLGVVFVSLGGSILLSLRKK